MPKISELAEATEATGAERVLVVQGGVTKTLSLALCKGPQGDDAPNPNLIVAVEMLPPDSDPTVMLTGDYPDLTLDLGIPLGDTGDAADNPDFGFAIDTLDPGEDATLEVTGTYPNLLLSFGIPKGTQGAAGSSAFAALTGAPGDNAALAAALGGKQAYDANLPAFPAGISTAEIGYLDGVTSGIQTQIDAKAPLASPAFTGNPTAITQTAGNNSTRLATTAYVDGAVNALLGANDAEVFKGSIDCSANPNYPAADAGHVYRVSVAGKIGGAAGVAVEIGDRLQCITDTTAAGNHATVGANWWITQANIDGAVVGPAGAVNNRVAVFDGTTGRLIKDSGLTLSGTNTGDQTTITGNAGSATILATGRTIAMTGDVTWNSGSFNGSANVTAVGTIAAGAVTYAKMQNVSATDKILGRASAGAGVVEEITCTAAGRALIDDADAAAQRATLGLGTAATTAASAYAPIEPRASTTGNVATPWAWNSDSLDGLAITAQTGDLTVSADAGTPVNFRKRVLRITASAANRVVTFTGGTAKGFVNAVGELLTTSGANWTYTVLSGKTVEFGLIYDTNAARWRIVGIATD